MKLWEGLSDELNYNVMFSQRGYLMIAHNVHNVQVSNLIAAANTALIFYALANKEYLYCYRNKFWVHLHFQCGSEFKRRRLPVNQPGFGGEGRRDDDWARPAGKCG